MNSLTYPIMPMAKQECIEHLVSLLSISTNNNLIKERIDVCREIINTTDSKLGLSLTHFASNRPDENYIPLRLLKQTGANIDIPDIVGYTPLHFMAMKGDLKGVSVLLEMGANPKHRNLMGGTYADLLRFNKLLGESTLSPLDSNRFSAHTKDSLYVDPQCQQPGVTYVSENVISSLNLSHLWKAIHEKAGELLQRRERQTTRLDAYAAYKMNPPKLAVIPITKNDAGEPLNANEGFCGLVAKSPIKKGGFIGEYVGEMFNELTDDSLEDSTYLWNEWPPVDSITNRSALSMANHGFRNAEGLDLYAVDGLPVRKMFIANEDIAVDQEIIIDYGPVYQWKHKIHELRPKALEEFIKKNPWKSTFPEVIHRGYSLKGTKENLDKLERFLYVLRHGDTLVKLVNRKLFTEDGLKAVKNFLDNDVVLKKIKHIFTPHITMAEQELAKLKVKKEI